MLALVVWSGATGCDDAMPSQGVDAAPKIDASIPGDAPADTPPDGSTALTKFDVGYIDEFTVAWSSSGSGFLGFAALVNTGTVLLNLNKISIVEVTDDDLAIDSVFAVENLSELPLAPLAPGLAAGLLGAGATALLVESGLVPERREEDALSFELRFPNQNVGFVGKTVHVRVQIAIGDAAIDLPFAVHFVASNVTIPGGVARLRSR